MSQRGRRALAAAWPYRALVRVRVLGAVEIVEDDGTVRRVGSPSQRTVLAALVAHRRRVVPFDVLVDALWGDVPPASAEATPRTYVSRLRRSLGGSLATRGDGYVLDLPDDAIDAAAFETLIGTARRTRGTEAIDSFDAAFDLWGGQPFGDQADVECVRAEGRRLAEVHAGAVESSISCLVEVGRPDEAVPVGEALVVDQPLREGAWAALIDALSAANRPADALRAYQRACGALAEAGLEPSARLRAAEQAVLAGARAVAPDVGGDVRLPRFASSFVGRHADCDRVLALLASSRVVTLVGPGGVGKTRLALEVARQAADTTRLRPRFVELANVRVGNDVADAIVSTLGLVSGGDAASDVLARTRRLDLLVVLDNAEHVADAVASAVEQLLGDDTTLRLLITSRERLGVDGEQVWRVAPLGIEGDAPAIRLFVDRASAANPELRLSANDDLVARVVELVDGLPLAVEMAASHLGVLTLAELASELETRHDMLASPRRTGPERHRTLASVLAWSEQLLNAQERRVLHELSCFAGPVPPADIEGVLADPDALAVTRKLVGRSLVTVDRRGERSSLGLLHTVRTFAAQRLEQAGRPDALGRRHAVWFAESSRAADRSLRSIDEVAAHDRFGAVFDELRAAHRWARRHEVDLVALLSEHLHLYAQSRLIDEPLRWAEELVDDLAPENPHLAAVLASAASRAVQRGDLDLARARAERAIAHGGSSPGSLLPALENLADTDLFQGRLESSEAAYAMLAEHAAEVSDLYYLAAARSGVLLARCYAGEKGRETFADLRAQPLGPSALGWLSYAEGELLLDDDPAASFGHYDRAISFAVASGNRYLEGVARISSCSLRARAGDVDNARRAFAETIHFWRRLSATTHQVTTLRNLAVLLRRIDRPDAAAALLGFLAGHPVPTYGAEAARLQEVESWTRERLSSDELDEGLSDGRTRSLAAIEDGVLAVLAV